MLYLTNKYDAGSEQSVFSMNILEIQKLTKHFEGVSAIEDLDLSIKTGSIKGIIGPNGSGKTTLVNLITGLLEPTSGLSLFQGRDITGLAPHLRTKLGIARTFQIPKVLPDMTCLDNVMLGRHCRHGIDILGTWLRLPFTNSRQELDIEHRALSVMNEMNMSGSAKRLAGELSWMEEQLLQICRAMVSEPSLLLLDEPTAGMGEAESEQVQMAINRIAEQGVTIIIVAHDMKLIKSLAEEVTCLSFGTKIAEGECHTVLADSKVNEVYLGSE